MNSMWSGVEGAIDEINRLIKEKGINYIMSPEQKWCEFCREPIQFCRCVKRHNSHLDSNG